MKIYDIFINFFDSFRLEAKEWCRGRLWQARLPVLLWFVYVLVRHLKDPLYAGILKGLDLGIHELGHLVFAPFGSFLRTAGGTILQCLAPVIAMVNFYRLRDFFAITLCFGWLAVNLFDVAVYMADARAMELPLVGPFAGNAEYVRHDWNYLLGEMGLLQYDVTLAFWVRMAAVFIMLFCFISGAWFLWQMFKLRE
ncbi:MAG: hypothetical protein V2A64_05405 [Candidatus Omnitrophota bacterium]